MIIFGQGAIRCHPYAYSEMTALSEGDVAAFDRSFWGHVGFVIRNASRALLLSLTRGRIAKVPNGPHARYYQKLAWASASFSFMADVALGSYGGSLKFREKITGRYADLLSWMYMITATIRRFEAEGERADHLPYFEWVMRHGFCRIQEAFDGIYDNIDVKGLRFIFRGLIGFWSRLNRLSTEPNDKLVAQMVDGVSRPGDLRDSLTPGIYIPESPNEPLAIYENAFKLSIQAADISKKITAAMRKKLIPKDRNSERSIASAVKAGVITVEEAAIIKRAEEARNDAIQVDSFDKAVFQPHLLDTEA
jgi:acyl-CoA dehydrogenase